MKTKGTSSRIGSSSSRRIALQLSLESKLLARVDTNGCREYEMRWKRSDTKSALPSFRLAASARRTFAGDFSGWRTPMAHGGWRRPKEPIEGSQEYNSHQLRGLGPVKGWRTPLADKYNWRKPKARVGDYGLEKITNQIHGLTRDWYVARTTDFDAALRPNPGFLLWLMGFPPEWEDALYEALETQSSPK